MVYRAVEKRFEMGGDPAQCNMMRSIRNDFSGERPHSECFIRFTGGQGRYAVVVRNELSREKFLAFQTDGETWAEIDGYSRTMPMEEAIADTWRDTRQRTGNERRPYGKRIKGIQAASASAPVRRNDLEGCRTGGDYRPLNTAQSTLTAGNTAATVKQVTESVNRLQTALDYVQKVSATVRRARMFTDLIDRQNRLNSNCLRTLEEAEKMDMKGLPGITSAVQDVVANNAAIISLTGIYSAVT